MTTYDYKNNNRDIIMTPIAAPAAPHRLSAPRALPQSDRAARLVPSGFADG
jgi:hypothetical protein